MKATAGQRAFSLIEILLGSAILVVVLYGLIQLLTTGRKMEEGVGGQLALQADARKALASFLRELQEGIVVVRPAPGQTLSYALVRDKVNRMAFYSIVPSGKDQYELRRDLTDRSGTKREVLLKGIARMTFTALTDRALMLHAIFGTGDRRFAFHTQVRLRNRAAAEPFFEAP
ncbi:MAG: hypothetical protein HY303_02695 [Candidatus Wallbacteria bacterium]|nr:hypothetical protein [Candidatus Wallbacteria bacterium]